ncbi:MAG TPA: hypothetical protein VGK93_07300 [Candidatus Eisenbacteria bacterium]|jgi:hypothetical protein
MLMDEGESRLRSPRATVLIFLLGAAALFTALVVGDVTPVLRGELADPDCYMRLVRVTQLHDTGAWYDDRFTRSNAPYGESSHWTHPLDLLLILPALALAPLLGFREALFWVGALIGPILLMASALAMVWAARPLWRDDRRYWLMFLLPAQLPILAYSAPGRADHHALIIFLSVLTLGFGIRLALGDGRWPWVVAAGSAGALGIWTGPEAIFFVCVVYLILAVQWIMCGDEQARKAIGVSAILAMGITVAILLERPPHALFTVEYDKVSLAHLYAIAMATAVWVTLFVLGRGMESRPKRWAALLLVSLAGVAILVTLAPGFVKGPMAAVEQRTGALWMSHIAEMEPQLPTNPAELATFLEFVGGIVLLVPFMIGRIWLAREEKAFGLYVALAISAVALLVLAIAHRRLSTFPAILAPVYAADLIIRCRHALRRIGLEPIRKIAYAALVAVVCCGPLAAGLILASRLSQDPSPGTGGAELRLEGIAAWLESRRSAGSSPIILATSETCGPELLYRTGYRVVAAPYHRGYQGILDLYDTWNARNETLARPIVERREVGVVLMCKSQRLGLRFPAPAGESTFYDQLQAGLIPPWLTPAKLPPRLARDFAVFDVHLAR